MAEKRQMIEKELDGHEIVQYNRKILIPLELKEWVMNWFRIILVHPGHTPMYNTIRQNIYWKEIK